MYQVRGRIEWSRMPRSQYEGQEDYAEGVKEVTGGARKGAEQQKQQKKISQNIEPKDFLAVHVWCESVLSLLWVCVCVVCSKHDR